GHLQPPTLNSQVQRLQQAQIVHDFVAAILAQDANANIVVTGDLNDFYFSAPLTTLKGNAPILTDPIAPLPLPPRYTYDYEGNSQDLDHTLMSDHLVNTAAPLFDVVHVNSEFNDQASDHDPQVTNLTLGPVLTGHVTWQGRPAQPNALNQLPL